jgi:S-adenosylmethionine hydrolase
MRIVTLTSDFGSENSYIASLKGAVFSGNTECQIVDITHEISNFELAEGAFVLENTYKFFPENTINILAVNCFYSDKLRILVLNKDGYYFIAPDNGILSLIFDEIDVNELYSFDYYPSLMDFSKIISKIIDQILSGSDLNTTGLEVENFVRRISLKPVISADTIGATVLFCDKFGNLILNLKKETFQKIQSDRRFKIFYSPRNYFDVISKNYTDVGIGDELCFFNSSGNLEIAVYMGNASELLGLAKDSPVQVIFENDQ